MAARPADADPHVPEAWSRVLAAVRERPGSGRVAVLGAKDTGKSTLARWLGERLAEGEATGRLDADPGQARIGPPGTVGLGREPGADDAPLALRFVGSPSPAPHLLALAVGLERLARRAGELGLARLVLDPPGFLDFPAGHAFHLHLLELLDPDHVVVLDGAALAPVLDPLRARGRPRIHDVEPSPEVVARSRAERRGYRAERYRRALEGARSLLLPADVPVHGTLPEDDDAWAGLLVGLLDREGFLERFGVAEGRRDGRLRVRARPVALDTVASVEVGTGRART